MIRIISWITKRFLIWRRKRFLNKVELKPDKSQAEVWALYFGGRWVR